MRFVVYGAGAIGGVIGGRLAQAGADVVLVARGAHGAAIRNRGLRLESPDETVTLTVDCVEHPREVAWRDGDVVLLAMKSQDTTSAVRALAESAAAAIPVVCVQNGVNNERVALRSFENVYGCCVMLPAGHLESGVVQASSVPITGLLDLGRFPTGVDDTAHQISAALESASFRSEPRSDIMRWKYRKLVMNLGNAVQALCDVASDDSRIIAMLEAEALRCLAAAGIDLASEEEDRVRRADHLQRRPIAGRERRGGSSWQSLARRAGAIEADFLNGEIALLGRLHGVPTPANALVQRLANQAARERVAPGRFSEGELLKMLKPTST